MMIRTNLCSELLDPGNGAVPLRSWVLLGVAALGTAALAYWWSLSNDLEALRREFDATKSKQRKLGAELDKARERAGALEIRIARRRAVVDFAKSRLNWAPLLEKIFAVVPGNVEISTVGGTSVRNGECSLQLEGRAAGAQPRLECDKFRVLLANELADVAPGLKARFSRLEDSEVPVHLGDETYPGALFRIDLSWINPPAHE